jgi:hypothetical protein
MHTASAAIIDKFQTERHGNTRKDMPVSVAQFNLNSQAKPAIQSTRVHSSTNCSQALTAL